MKEYHNIQAIAKINYTNEDIIDLIELASYDNSELGWKIQKGFLGVRVDQFRLVLHKIIKKLPGGQFNEFRDFIYTVPFEEIPLHINSESLNLFVLWKVKIGK